MRHLVGDLAISAWGNCRLHLKVFSHLFKVPVQRLLVLGRGGSSALLEVVAFELGSTLLLHVLTQLILFPCLGCQGEAKQDETEIDDGYMGMSA